MASIRVVLRMRRSQTTISASLRAPKLAQVLGCFEERLLHDVRSPQLAAKTRLELEPRQQFKVVAITLQLSGIQWSCLRHVGPLGKQTEIPAKRPAQFLGAGKLRLATPKNPSR